MTDFIIYLLKSGLMLSIFYIFYIILLRKETFYGFNRLYLLSTLLLSFILPFVNIQVGKPLNHVENKFVYVEHAFLEVADAIELVEIQTAENVNTYPVIFLFFLIGMIFTAARVSFQLFSIKKNIKKYGIKIHEKYKYVLMDKHQTTHSFFRFIFVQKSVYKDSIKKEVLIHEHFHADKWHSLDLLTVGILSILQWFNPFIYLFKRALTETHEFQADQALLDMGTDKVYYQQLLLSQVRSILFAGLTSNFNQSLIKNRLKMMNKIRSRNRAQIKYLLVLPVVFLISIAFAVSQEKMEESIAKLVINTADGPITATSKMVELNLTLTPSRMETNGGMYYDTDFEKIVFLGDEVHGSTEKGSFSVKAENIYYDSNERRLIGFSDDLVPSISPISENDLKRISSGFGMRIHPITKENKMHNGIDFSAATGTKVIATANGEIRKSEFRKDYGNRVVIDHFNGFSTSYSQLTQFIVKEGQSVLQGEVIGYVGNTGLSTAPHLHYEIMKDGKYVDPKDYLGKSAK